MVRQTDYCVFWLVVSILVFNSELFSLLFWTFLDSCVNNTSGERCEKCQPGYFGNGTLRNCKLCECNLCGSVSNVCDDVSGECTCKPGVTGADCNKCQVSLSCRGNYYFIPIDLQTLFYFSHQLGVSIYVTAASPARAQSHPWTMIVMSLPVAVNVNLE